MDIALNSLPDDLFKSLKCYLCGKFLSVGPVISISDDGKPYKCGRCQDIPSEKTIRNLCYEKVAVFLSFPCSYEDCDVRLAWGQVERHEKFCKYRIIQCVDNGCDTLMKVEDFENHFKLHSTKRVFQGSIQNYALKKYCSTIFLLKHLTHQFFVVIRYCTGTIYAGVFSIPPLLCNTYFNLTITGLVTCSPSISYKAPVIEYDEAIHCIRCMRQKCHLGYHKFSVNYDHCGSNLKSLPLVINSKALETLLFLPSKLTYSVNILPQCNNVSDLSSTCSDSGISENLEINVEN